MNSPLELFKNKLPQELLNIIQTYLINDVAYQVLKEYYNYLYYKKELYEDFVYTQYIEPNCTCHSYYNQIAQRWKHRECSGCYYLEYTNTYIPKDFRLCIDDNPQYGKIVYGKESNYKLSMDYDNEVDYHYD